VPGIQSSIISMGAIKARSRRCRHLRQLAWVWSRESRLAICAEKRVQDTSRHTQTGSGRERGSRYLPKHGLSSHRQQRLEANPESRPNVRYRHEFDQSNPPLAARQR